MTMGKQVAAIAATTTLGLGLVAAAGVAAVRAVSACPDAAAARSDVFFLLAAAVAGLGLVAAAGVAAARRLHRAVRDVAAEIQRVADAAGRGNLGERGDAARFHGAAAEVVAAMNATLAAITAPVHEATTVLVKLGDRELGAAM